MLVHTGNGLVHTGNCSVHALSVCQVNMDLLTLGKVITALSECTHTLSSVNDRTAQYVLEQLDDLPIDTEA